MSSFDDEGYEAFSSGGGSDPRVSCGICGRKFNPDVLGRHEPICAKSSQKKRKTFNTAKQRAEGTELAQFSGGRGRGRGRAAPPRSKPAPDIPAPKSNWRQQHQDFINAIRSAKGVQDAIAQGKPLPPPPPPSINPDYIQCPYCSRRFNQKAIERHIPFCKEQHERLPNKSKVDPKAVAKQNTRLQYQPPKLRSNSKANANSSNSLSPPNRYSSSSEERSSSASSQRGGYSSGRPPSNRSRGGSRGRGTRQSPGSNAYRDQDSPGSGRALRTGRTAEGYSEARELSATQRNNSGLTRKYPSDHSIHSRASSSSRNEIGEIGDFSDFSNVSSPEGSFGRPMSRTRNGADSGYFGSNGNIARNNPPPRDAPREPPPSAAPTGKYCYECGSKYPVATARFCCECGVRRM